MFCVQVDTRFAYCALSTSTLIGRPDCIDRARIVKWIDACKNFANHHRALVEPACGACLALSYEGKIREMQNDMNANGCVVVEVCGGAITDLSSFM